MYIFQSRFHQIFLAEENIFSVCFYFSVVFFIVCCFFCLFFFFFWGGGRYVGLHCRSSSVWTYSKHILPPTPFTVSKDSKVIYHGSIFPLISTYKQWQTMASSLAGLTDDLKWKREYQKQTMRVSFGTSDAQACIRCLCLPLTTTVIQNKWSLSNVDCRCELSRTPWYKYPVYLIAIMCCRT